MRNKLRREFCLHTVSFQKLVYEPLENHMHVGRQIYHVDHLTLQINAHVRGSNSYVLRDKYIRHCYTLIILTHKSSYTFPVFRSIVLLLWQNYIYFCRIGSYKFVTPSHVLVPTYEHFDRDLFIFPLSHTHPYRRCSSVASYSYCHTSIFLQCLPYFQPLPFRLHVHTYNLLTAVVHFEVYIYCLLYTSPSPRDS